jgi:site-specific DNA-adenine methylase
MSFGLPYKGSKSAIAKDIIGVLPGGNRLVDLFCGGCAVTDYAMKKTDRYRKFLVNDMDPMLPATYLKALCGGFAGEDRWISREEFHRLKNEDPYVSLCFSFGNNRSTYMYGPDIEPYKEAIHNIVFWENYDKMAALCPAVVKTAHEFCDGKDRKGRRLAFGKAVAAHVKAMGSVEYWQSNPMFRAVKVKWSEERRGISSAQWNRGSPLERLERLKSLESLESLQSLQSLQSLERLESLESLESQEAHIVATADDYCNYAYQDGDVVYCDPPYANTSKYTVDFDHETFWQWCRTRDFPVYVSEYHAPEDFISVWSKEKRSLFHSSNLSAPVVEHLFLHKKWI